MHVKAMLCTTLTALLSIMLYSCTSSLKNFDEDDLYGTWKSPPTDKIQITATFNKNDTYSWYFYDTVEKDASKITGGYQFDFKRKRVKFLNFFSSGRSYGVPVASFDSIEVGDGYYLIKQSQ